MINLFVYGTLKKGFRNDFGFSRSPIKFDKIKGKMYKVPGGDYSFPALILDEEGIVEGEIHQVSEEAMEIIDRIEGSMYKKVPVMTESGQECTVYAWALGKKYLENYSKNNWED